MKSQSSYWNPEYRRATDRLSEADNRKVPAQPKSGDSWFFTVRKGDPIIGIGVAIVGVALWIFSLLWVVSVLGGY